MGNRISIRFIFMYATLFSVISLLRIFYYISARLSVTCSSNGFPPSPGTITLVNPNMFLGLTNHFSQSSIKKRFPRCLHLGFKSSSRKVSLWFPTPTCLVTPSLVMVSVSSTVSTPMSGLKVCIIPHFVTPPFSDILEDQSLEPTELLNIKTGSLQQFVQNAESKGQGRSSGSFMLLPTLSSNYPSQLTIWRGAKLDLFPTVKRRNTRLSVPCDGTITTMLMLYKSGH